MADTLLKVENLVKEYDGQRILDGIDLTLAQGEVVVVVGPSGCGKKYTAPLYQCIRARAGRFDQPAWQGYPQGQQKILPKCGRRSEWYSRATSCFHI